MRLGPTSLAWLQLAVAELQGADRLLPVWVVVAIPYLGAMVTRSLAEAGCANARTVTLRQVATRVAGRQVDGARRPLSGVLEGAATRLALRDAVAEPFSALAHHPSVQAGLASLFRELRHLDEPTVMLDALAGRGSLPRATVRAFRRYVDLSADFYDVTDQTRLADSAKFSWGPPLA